MLILYLIDVILIYWVAESCKQLLLLKKEGVKRSTEKMQNVLNSFNASCIFAFLMITLTTTLEVLK